MCETHQEEQVVVPALLVVNTPARGGGPAQNVLAKTRSLKRMCYSFLNEWDDE